MTASQFSYGSNSRVRAVRAQPDPARKDLPRVERLPQRGRRFETAPPLSYRSLPLSDGEKAEAVRRLLINNGGSE